MKKRVLITLILSIICILNVFSSENTTNINYSKEVGKMSTQTVFKTEEGRQKILSVYDMVMSTWQVEYKDQYIDTSFGTTHLIECGDPSKEQILLFHGSSSNSLMWLADMVELSQHFHVYSVDILGEAGKSDPVRLNLHNSDYSEWVKELLIKLNIQKTQLLGNSLGGWVSLKFATTCPDAVSKIVLIAPSGITEVKPSFMETMMTCAMKGPEGMLELNKMIYGVNELPQQVIDFTNLVMENFNPIVEALPLFPSEVLQKLTMPVLYIAGENDILFDSQKAAEILRENCKNGISRIIKNNGHVVYNTMDMVIPFLKEK